MGDYFKYLSVDEKEFMALLRENEFRCNASGRQWMADRVKVLHPRPVHISDAVLRAAEDLGGLKPSEKFPYPNAQGGTSVARVCTLENLPESMVRPFVWIGGGHMLAPLYAMEILRFHYKETGELLPFVSSGKEGNKGLFKELFYRDEGIIRRTEYDSYCRIMEMLTTSKYAFANYEECEDTDTEGNLVELYDFAKSRGFKEVTYIICTGNPFYDKRLLAEWMWQLRQEKFAEVKVNLVMVHCPLFYTFNMVSVPEARLSEIFLGYMAASLGPLAKDTITFDGETESERPERYLMPGVEKADWKLFYDVIVNYSNMGWPNYQELLYGIPHEQAVANIIISDLFARASFIPNDYDYGISGQVGEYLHFIYGDDTAARRRFPEGLRATRERSYFRASPYEARPYTD